jgi:EAL domain-containing protein (putative c-di-GMP-specific phosphodiesterase class I)
LWKRCIATASLAIGRSIVAHAEAPDLSVTAEGVETAAQRAQLQAPGCDRCQRYLFANPLASNDLVDVLSRTLPRATDTERAAA